ncbi:hypothetical protein [Nocardioides daphniae]|uniref:Uncharacterized protein n=1 Tax=Nocardioides daphniae TaxID=402297 RepID=A0A4P7U7R0_9ACTN|nr:hypothetical protein [Nocardioides daphniae]QCC76026.1 hypothetical protein E2C04_00345 [Nocardioides daphniae]GGD10992.1 hypothetical protein GCM10007231_07200 [Nocardioides daphniae]
MNAMLWTRAFLVAAVATALGTTAHVTAGGLLPGPITAVAAFSSLLVIAAAALTTPAGYVRIVVLVGGGQAAVHLLLTVTAGHVAPHAPVAARPVPPLQRARPGGVRDQLAVVPDPDRATTTATPGLQHLVDHVAGTDAPMMAAHLAAAAGVAWWLWRGEQSAWALLALLWGWVTTPTGAPMRCTARARVLSPRPEDRACRLRESIGSISRRGPPLAPMPST